VAVAWNVLGILDLVAPFPVVLIPAFGTPLSLMLHSLSLRQLRRLGHRNVTGLPVCTGQVASPLATQT
jgi:hypothetical protein